MSTATRAITWNGHGWSRGRNWPSPAARRWRSPRCPALSATFCAAVDILGRLVTWYGRPRWSGASWSGRTRSAARGWSRCLVRAASFCAAVGGAGQTELILDERSRSRPRPDRHDRHRRYKSVSCASARFCAASDWSGHVLTFDGANLVGAAARWSRRPAAAGGGTGRLSCPTATVLCRRWTGRAGRVTWNGATWKLPSSTPAARRPDGGVVPGGPVLHGGRRRRRADLERAALVTSRTTSISPVTGSSAVSCGTTTVVHGRGLGR